MAERLDIQKVISFVNGVVQAEKMGSSLASVLRIQAEHRRSKCVSKEPRKKAMEALVKFVGPLVICVFPTTFIVLAFPIFMKFFMEGML